MKNKKDKKKGQNEPIDNSDIKSNQDISENEDPQSLDEFIEDPKLINSKNLEKLLNLIQEDLEAGKRDKIPFLKICPNLIKLYIESGLDKSPEEGKYYKVFENLKKNYFINRKYLNPIYEYFSDILYDIKKENKDDEDKFSKFPKVQKLWKIFYTIPEEKKSTFSSICFNKGYLKLIPLNYYINKLKEKKNFLSIVMHFDKCLIQREKNKSSKIICINKGCDENSIEVNLKDIFNNNGIIEEIEKKEDLNLEFEIQISENTITITSFVNKIVNVHELEKKIDFQSIKNIYLLKDFYGVFNEISIRISLDHEYKGLKLSLANQIFELFKDVDSNEKEKLFEIEYSNYITKNFTNYFYNEFNIFKYLGGLKPLIPFVSLINGIYEKNNIAEIGGIKKNEYLKGFISDIFYVLNQFCQELKIEEENNSKKEDISKTKYELKNDKENNSKEEDISQTKLEKHLIFILYLIFQIDSKIIPETIITFIKGYKNKIDYKGQDFKKIDWFIKNYKLNSIIESFIDIYKIKSNEKNPIFNDEKEEKIEDKKNEKNNNKINNIDNEKHIEKILLNSKYNLNQLYRHYVKELFIYNRYWSNKEIFFEKNNNINNNNNNNKVDNNNKENNNNIDNNNISNINNNNIIIISNINNNDIDNNKNVVDNNKKNKKLKYKQLTYYTRNYQQPIIYPILEYDRNYPKFSKYKGNIFVNEKENKNDIEMINYDFNLKKKTLS